MNKFSLKNIAHKAKMIEGNDKIRAKKCLAAIKTFLTENNYELQPRFMITGAQIKSGYMIISKRQIILKQQTLSAQQDAEQGLAGIETILDQYDCIIQPQFLLLGAKIQAGYSVAAKPRVPMTGGN